jgi:hypothetical protein
VGVTASATADDLVSDDAERPGRGLWARYWPLVVLGLAAIAVSVAVHHWIYPAYSWNRDEPVYLWQVKALRSGVILPTDGGAPTFFQPWLSGHGPGYFFSQYTLGWPIPLLVGQVLFGTAASALAFGSLLAVLGTYALARTLTSDTRVSLTAAAFMLLSPIFMIQSGVYLGYLFTLGLGLFFGAALITGVERRRPARLVVAGLLIGWLFMTRPFDAVLWAAAFGAYVVIAHWREWARLFRAGAWALLGALPLLVATLAYNRKVTGSFTQFPITAADPLDTFGFGLRRLMPTFGKADYTVSVALRSLAKHGLWLPLFLFGSYLGLIVAGVGAWLHRRQRSTLALLLLIAAFPAGYFFFWGLHVSAAGTTLSGPIYLIPLFASLSIFMAIAIVHVWQHRRAVCIGTVAVLVVVTIPVAANRLELNHRISATQAPWRDSTDAVKGRSLMFVQQSGIYLLLLNPFSSNAAALDGRILYANDLGPADLDLIASEHGRGRTPYLQKTTVPTNVGVPNNDPKTPRITVEKLDVMQTGAATVHVHVTNPTSAPVVVLTLDVGDHEESRTVATDSSKGASYDVEWTVAAPGASADPDAVTLPTRLGTVTVTSGYGDTVAAASKPTARQVIPYRIDAGEAELLLPSQPAIPGRLNGKPAWIELDQLPQLEVQATPHG